MFSRPEVYCLVQPTGSRRERTYIKSPSYMALKLQDSIPPLRVLLGLTQEQRGSCPTRRYELESHGLQWVQYIWVPSYEKSQGVNTTLYPVRVCLEVGGTRRKDSESFDRTRPKIRRQIGTTDIIQTLFYYQMKQDEHVHKIEQPEFVNHLSETLRPHKSKQSRQKERTRGRFLLQFGL